MRQVLGRVTLVALVALTLAGFFNSTVAWGDQKPAQTPPPPPKKDPPKINPPGNTPPKPTPPPSTPPKVVPLPVKPAPAPPPPAPAPRPTPVIPNFNTGPSMGFSQNNYNNGPMNPFAYVSMRWPAAVSNPWNNPFPFVNPFQQVWNPWGNAWNPWNPMTVSGLPWNPYVSMWNPYMPFGPTSFSPYYFGMMGGPMGSFGGMPGAGPFGTSPFGVPGGPSSSSGASAPGIGGFTGF